MITKYIIILTVFCLSWVAYAQNQIHAQCTTTHEDGQLLDAFIESLNDPNQVSFREEPVYRIHLDANNKVPVVLHAVESENGQVSITESEARRVFQRAAQYFDLSGSRVQFAMDSIEFNTVNDSSFFELSSHSDEDFILYKNHANSVDTHKHKLNIFFVNRIENTVCGSSSYLYHPQQGISIATEATVAQEDRTCVKLHDDLAHVSGLNPNDSLIGTLAHEIGHFFNARHTHDFLWTRPRDKPIFELVNREPNNCMYRGDNLCDTPADPGLYNTYVDINIINESPLTVTCSYIGEETHDSLGDPYEPDMANIMSYSPDACGLHFSSGQIAVMNAGLDYRTGVISETVYSLDTVYPNAFVPNSGETLTIIVSTQDEVSLKAYLTIVDLSGRKMSEHVLDTYQQTSQNKGQFTWDGQVGKILPNGMYFLKLDLYPSHLQTIDIKTKHGEKPLRSLSYKIFFKQS
ncbi:MAG TPA: zinc-dependent metalloprotease [Oligoflexia bacterium]|nr:zinc-dependent metalloprotease [Oligoflexia bacterium]HMR25089.1 zinc-dependent metalloprotease [Oligoflexia bacterium]